MCVIVKHIDMSVPEVTLEAIEGTGTPGSGVTYDC